MTNQSKPDEFAAPVVFADDAAAAQAAGELSSALERLARLNMHPRFNTREIALLRIECREILESISAHLLA